MTRRSILSGRAARVMGAALSATAIAFAVLSATPAHAATGSTNPYLPSYQHPYRHGAVPTIAQLAKIKQYQAKHPPAIIQDSTQNLRFGGGVDGIGVTTGHEKVYLVFWGTQWGTQSTNGSGDLTFSNDTAGAAPKLQEMFKGLGTGGELWSGVMTQYCEGVATGTQICGTAGQHVEYPTGGALSGVWYHNSAAAPSAATALQIGNEAVLASTHFGNTTAASNRSAQYVILSPHGTNPDNYQTGGFCAWHDWNGDVGASSPNGDIAFTNMPYTLDVGTTCGQNFVNGGSAGTLDGYTMVEGHEYSETITDQNPAGGYTDTSGAENADKCAWRNPGTQGGAGNVSMGTGSFAEQGTWSNDSVSGTGQCEISHAIVTGGGAGNPTVNNPGNQTGTVGVAVSLSMSASGGTPPYTWSATGLPAGLSISSSSGVISGTPTTATTYSVTVTATDSASHSGNAAFSWTINSTGGCGSPGQKLGNPGFESGTSPWTQTAGVIGSYTSEPAHSGTRNAWLDGYGTSHTDYIYQNVTLPSGCSGYSLTFYLHIDTAETTTTTAYDTLKVQVLNSAGTSVLATLATYSNLNHATGYQLRTLNLSAYAGQTVRLRWYGQEDSSLQTSFVVDDTACTVS
jgi:serine protease